MLIKSWVNWTPSNGVIVYIYCFYQGLAHTLNCLPHTPYGEPTEQPPGKGPSSLRGLPTLLGFNEHLMDTCPQWEAGQGTHTALGSSPALKMYMTNLSGEPA